MKKLFLVLALALTIKMQSAALPMFICTSQGFLFQVTWFTNSAGQLDYVLESSGPGSCTGGPWHINYSIFNPNVGNGDQPTLASAELHAQLSTYAEPTAVDYDSAPVKEAVSLSTTSDTPTKSFNPNGIHAVWAKSIALANGQSVYFMKFSANPTVSHSLNFQIWSTKSQTVNIKLIDLSTGLDAWTSTMELTEGKNIKSIFISGSINGTHVLQVNSTENVLTGNIVIN